MTEALLFDRKDAMSKYAHLVEVRPRRTLGMWREVLPPPRSPETPTLTYRYRYHTLFSSFPDPGNASVPLKPKIRHIHKIRTYPQPPQQRRAKKKTQQLHPNFQFNKPPQLVSPFRKGLWTFPPLLLYFICGRKKEKSSASPPEIRDSIILYFL
jgi:hypothetical protein